MSALAHPRLDSLRALAVLLVAYSHWAPLVFGPNWPGRGIPLGAVGVQVFFVLSGFLITSILRDTNIQSAEIYGRLKIIGSFVARRALRIFPPYYLLIGTSTAFGVWPFGEYLPYLLTFTQNFAFFLDQVAAGPAAHLWTLALEEQFYLCWPWLCLFVARPRLIAGLIVFAVACICTLAYTSIAAPDVDMVLTIPVPGLLSIACGCLLALVLEGALGRALLAAFFIFTGILAISSVALALGAASLLMPLAHTIHFTFISCLSVMVVALALGRKVGGWGGILDAPGLRLFGRVSYGFYLYHLIAPIGINSIERRGWLLDLSPFLQLSLLLLVTLCLTLLSWFLVERPLLGLKRFFPYKKDGHG